MVPYARQSIARNSASAHPVGSSLRRWSRLVSLSRGELARNEMDGGRSARRLSLPERKRASDTRASGPPPSTHPRAPTETRQALRRPENSLGALHPSSGVPADLLAFPPDFCAPHRLCVPALPCFVAGGPVCRWPGVAACAQLRYESCSAHRMTGSAPPVRLVLCTEHELLTTNSWPHVGQA